MKIMYHVFTNSNDEWTDNYEIAKALYREFIEDYGCARLYREIWKEPTAYQDQPEEEDCLKSYGEYPL